MKTQIQALIAMMKAGWTSTAHAQAAGITSPHSRISEFKYQHRAIRVLGSGYYRCYCVNGKDYRLKERSRTIVTRWGKTVIKEHRLEAVK